MKHFFVTLFSLVLLSAYGQSGNFQVYLDSAKTLFKSERNLNREQLDQFDYQKIVVLLEKAIAINPKSSEARYFLGYTYSRINSRDGRGMIDMKRDLVFKSSEQLEQVIQQTPKYTGELIVLDPYSKLTAEWGSLAMSYWYNHQADSAVWAFREGKKRGGFSEFILAVNRKVLDTCSKNAVLISSGDNSSIPLWYLQIVENYRKDVAVVDVSLLNTSWYPAFLAKTEVVAFDLPDEVLDTIEYCEWTSTTVTINDFSWKVNPSYYDQYLLRGDRVFLSLLKHTKFQRDFYFTFGFPDESRLSLDDYLVDQLYVDKLVIGDQPEVAFSAYKETISTALKLSEILNLNSQDQIKTFNFFRYEILRKADSYFIENDLDKAREIIALLDKLADEKKVPYQNNSLKEYAAKIRQRVAKK